MSKYHEFIRNKEQLAGMAGFEPTYLPDGMFDFQRALVTWAVRKGRSAIFADCGMGKTLMQLAWAQNVVEHTNKPVLILTPLAVAAQTVAEAEKFGIEAQRSNDGTASKKLVVTNYEKLHHFSSSDFAGVVCDESSILKNFDGATKKAITYFTRKMKYRLLCTATAAPNDYIELGTSSEALGELGYTDMLGMFFKNMENSIAPASRGRHNDAWYGSKWAFKPHAETAFWRWLCSWARACRKPSDLGFDDGPFVLPPLTVNHHVVKASTPMDGYLFVIPAKSLEEQRHERKHTLRARCEYMAEKLGGSEPAIGWCYLNSEADLMERMVSGAVQVSGSDSDEAKEEKFNAFSSGQARVLITKPKIGALGLNWQHCARMAFFISHSFEQYYQGVRRCWRFGQTKPVEVDLICTEGEYRVLDNLSRKAAAAEKMFESIVAEMNNAMKVDRSTEFYKKASLPTWLQGVANEQHI